MSWKTYAAAMLTFNLVSLLRRLPPAAVPGRAAPEPAGPRRRVRRLLVQHGGELRHQHELAGLWRRVHHELSHPDARRSTVQNFVSAAAGMAVLVALIRGFARRSAADHRQLLGGSHADHAVHPPPAVGRPRASPWSPRASSRPSRAYPKVAVVQPTQLRRAREGQGRQCRSRREGPAQDQEVDAHRAGHRGGAGRLADRHQAARHQRRRLLQRQLRAPVREPHAAVELPRAARHPAHSRRPLLHLRRHGRRHAPGLDGADRHDRDLRRSCWPCARWPSSAGRSSRSRASTMPPSALQSGGNMEGKEVRFGIANSALWATATTAASNGSVNSMHDSYTPIGRAGADVVDPARRGRLRRASARASTACSSSPSSRCSWRASWWAAPPSTSARRSRRTR